MRAQIQEMVDETGINYFLGVFYFGDLTLDQVQRSMDLFTSKVIGEIKTPSAVA